MKLAQRLSAGCPTRKLRGLALRELVPALAALLPSGRREGLDPRRCRTAVDVFVTFERRGDEHIPCGFRAVINGSEFAVDDGSDEFARTTLAGTPTFDAHQNVQISTVRRSVDGRRRGSSLWLAHDLSMLAVDDEIVHLKKP
jgi:hypothetical protein